MIMLLLLMVMLVMVVGMVVQLLICQRWNKTVAQHDKYVGIFTPGASVSYRLVILDAFTGCPSHSCRHITAPVMLLLVQSRAVVHLHVLNSQFPESSHTLF